MVPEFREYYPRETFCKMQNDSALWSEDVVRKTLQRFAGTNFNLQDAQMFIKDYLSELCEEGLRGESV